MGSEGKPSGKNRSVKNKGQEQEMPFENALERLEKIVETLESGEASLEKSLSLFEEGVSLSRHCNQRLNEAERRLEILVKRADGKDVAEPFAEEELFPETGEDKDRSS